MKLVEQLKKKIEAIGATLDVGDHTINCDAPSGYVWSANGFPTLAIHYATNHQTWLAKSVREEMDALRMGLDKVTDPEDIAAMRHDQGDDTWGASADAPERIEWPS